MSFFYFICLILSSLFEIFAIFSEATVFVMWAIYYSKIRRLFWQQVLLTRTVASQFLSCQNSLLSQACGTRGVKNASSPMCLLHIVCACLLTLHQKFLTPLCSLRPGVAVKYKEGLASHLETLIIHKGN